MLNVSFKNIPSAYREYFERAGFKMEKGGLFKKPTETQPIEVYEAEECLKKLVDLLNDSEDIELSMTVYDDEDEKEYNLDNVHVTTETQGLEDLADQVAVENGNDDESMNLVWLLHDQLDQEDSDDDEDDEDDDDYADNQRLLFQLQQKKSKRLSRLRRQNTTLTMSRMRKQKHPFLSKI